MVFLFGLLSIDCGLEPRSQSRSHRSSNVLGQEKPKPCKSLTHCATHCCALARPSQVAGGVPVPTMRAKKHFPLFRPKSSKGYHASSTAPSPQLPKYYQSISRALQECLLKSSLGLRPPGQACRIAEPTRDEKNREIHFCL